MSRDLPTVLDAIIVEMPGTEAPCIRRLAAVSRRAEFTPPEVIATCWESAAVALEDVLQWPWSDVPPEWVIKVRAIWMGIA